MRRLVNGLTITDDKFESIIIAIKKFLKPVTNIILERHRFFGLQTNESEDIASFLVRLRRQSKLCNFANEEIDSVSNQLVRDQLIKGLNNSKLTEHILAAGNLSLNDMRLCNKLLMIVWHWAIKRKQCFLCKKKVLIIFQNDQKMKISMSLIGLLKTNVLRAEK